MTNEEAILEIKMMHPQRDYNDAQFEAVCLAIDALKFQVVTCKDCKYWESYDKKTGYCDELYNFVRGDLIGVVTTSDSDDFCSYGEVNKK